MKTEGTQGMKWTVLLLSLLVIYALMPNESWPGQLGSGGVQPGVGAKTPGGAPGAFQNQSIQVGGPKQPQSEKSCGTHEGVGPDG